MLPLVLVIPADSDSNAMANLDVCGSVCPGQVLDPVVCLVLIDVVYSDKEASPERSLP